MPRPRRGRGRRPKKDGDLTTGQKLAGTPDAEIEQPIPPIAPLKVGQRVRLCSPFRPSGGRSITGTVTRAGEMVDVKWDDGRVSHMLTLALVEPHVETEEDLPPGLN